MNPSATQGMTGPQNVRRPAARQKIIKITSHPLLPDWRVPESNRHFPNSPYKARDRFKRPSVG